MIKNMAAVGQKIEQTKEAARVAHVSAAGKISYNLPLKKFLTLTRIFKIQK